jgi:hypothetical protein
MHPSPIEMATVIRSLGRRHPLTTGEAPVPSRTGAGRIRAIAGAGLIRLGVALQGRQPNRGDAGPVPELAAPR